MNQANKLLEIAQKVVADTPDFFLTKGPGLGDRATIAFMGNLHDLASQEFGSDYAEQSICGNNSFRVDYYFPSDATIVEVALGLSKPKTEFEKDILKAIMAKEAGHEVERLVFISKPGALKKCSQPGRRAIIDWLLRNDGIATEVHELELRS